MNFLREPKGIVIHHSATRDLASISFDSVRAYHVNVNRWDDIGYHYLIEDVYGEIVVFTGRGLQYEGAHAKGSNDHIGVCVVGNFMTEVPSAQTLKVLLRLLHSLLILYPNLTVQDVKFHRTVWNTDCPGKMFPSLESIRSRLKVIIEEGL